jgi:hypothetical protein
MEQTLSLNTPWPFAQKLAFRFFFIFFVLYIFFNPIGSIPLLGGFFQAYMPFANKLIEWFAGYVLHLPLPVTGSGNGSGDTTYNYLVWLFCGLGALCGCAIWSVIRRGPSNYNVFYYWLLVILRYYVAFIMINYGAIKVIKLQFPAPGLSRLMQNYGDSSPMGLAWTFMGFSRGYNYFTGIAEVSCGLLLLFRRTTSLGSILGLVVSANIMAINYCFDVPVKIISTMLVVMCLFILFKDFKRLLSFFFLNKVVEPADIKASRFKKKWANIVLISFKYLLILSVVITTAWRSVERSKQYGDSAPKRSLHGVYKVQSYIRKRGGILLTPADDVRWRRLIIKQGYADVVFMNDSTINYIFKDDTVAKKFTMYAYPDTSRKYVFNYSVSKPNVLTIKGALFRDSINMTMQKYDEKSFLLMNRGFHWISESPYNY